MSLTRFERAHLALDDVRARLARAGWPAPEIERWLEERHLDPEMAGCSPRSYLQTFPTALNLVLRVADRDVEQTTASSTAAAGPFRVPAANTAIPDQQEEGGPT